jgi:2-dehydro-3-deoxyphosphogluconate aldolase/(4S)-4-hydroxy-2-oxoglutarate aldolase
VTTPAPVRRQPLPGAILEPGVVAIVRRRPPERLAALAAALMHGGIRAIEITFDGDDALTSIASLATRAGGPGGSALLVGAGTVLDVDAATRAVEAGAGFLVSPHLDEAIVRWAVDAGVPVMPAAMTPTEVLAAWRAGASAIKVFPASAVGPSFVRELAGPLPGIPLVPTGGLTAASLGEFVAAGAIAVGLGGGLLGDGEPVGVTARAHDAVREVAAARAAASGRSVPSAAGTEVRR